MNLEELRAQVKELDEQIETKARELAELRSFRSSLGGSTPTVKVIDDSGAMPSIVTTTAVDPVRQWTPEQQAALKAEEERVKEHRRFNYGMPMPTVNVRTQRVQLPPGVKPADVIPPEMQEFLTK
jgi:hypothetical protein